MFLRVQNSAYFHHDLGSSMGGRDQEKGMSEVVVPA